ncbi:hypothetical protein FPQ18DRAFT_313052 [Pyronema domesticum]|uniref:tRNA-splicing endonuclease subunit Sen2 n=1 Tax=Pyronema omphalodes (strain CBS 100304) TaxID=1076935 RepID=U4LL80_PYROM|nr:hypothetical protein FPQ18DRAFT_313052 [Pyronema domesticum]CCX32698.1 Similar to Probable tRNA-splicing endonuclease subunit sen2; acc. no. Q8TFH7 [Pyronema omphalodes CBS 100304]
MSSEPPTAKPPLPRTKRPNYALLHANLLPLTIQALPPLIPHNPLSILQILYTYFFCRVPCQPEPLYTGVFNPTTRSVHVTDTRSIKAFWTSGFFGKGSLSRSEPTWISRRRRALGVIGKDEALTAEEVTERRRKERKEFKLERARAEKEKIQNQLAQEGKVQFETGAVAPSSENKSVTFAPPETPAEEKDQPAPQVVEVEDLEHLQLTLEEAFFLSYGLGALQIMNAEGNKPIEVPDALSLFRKFSYFPHLEDDAILQPDDVFLMNYVVYHHFRSLGWVVRPGMKFSVDYLLYNRGPVFSHAEFGILILPAYSNPYWAADPERKKRESRPWHWLHSVNRVSAQVKKTLIMVYVEVPPPHEIEGLGITDMLKKYGVREVSLRRFLVARNRD